MSDASPFLFYRHCGGDLIAGGRWPLNLADAEALHGLHMEEASAAEASQDDDRASRARALAEQLVCAQDAAARWLRAASPAISRPGPP